MIKLGKWVLAILAITIVYSLAKVGVDLAAEQGVLSLIAGWFY